MSVGCAHESNADRSSRVCRSRTSTGRLGKQPSGHDAQEPPPSEAAPLEVEPLERIPDMTSLKAGDRVTVHSPGHFDYLAEVEEIAPQLGVVWIREVRIGARRMVGLDELRTAL